MIPALEQGIDSSNNRSLTVSRGRNWVVHNAAFGGKAKPLDKISSSSSSPWLAVRNYRYWSKALRVLG